MKKVAIIGAGQLGSRHLQGVLKSSFEFDVYVIDPNRSSLEVAQSRASEIEHNHEISFEQSITALPRELDLVIVATNSDVRLSVLKQLLDQSKVGTLILEKVLFQSLHEYDEAKELIQNTNTKTFVNHARRMQDTYTSLRKKISAYNQEHFVITAFGSNWGLGCNGLHVSDLIAYLLDDDIQEYATDGLDKTILQSKRKGFVEFTGTLTGKTTKGNRFSITSTSSTDGTVTPISFAFYSPGVRITIQEGVNPFISIAELSNKLEVYSKTEELLFQSDLSTTMVEKALNAEAINLTSYEEAMKNHLLFIHSLNKHIETITGERTTLCPIT